jgi:hypothetical protein
MQVVSDDNVGGAKSAISGFPDVSSLRNVRQLRQIDRHSHARNWRDDERVTKGRLHGRLHAS